METPMRASLNVPFFSLLLLAGGCSGSDKADDTGVLTATESCSNDVDDDGDGQVDCDDSDCTDSPACGTPTELSCDNALDDDGDGTTDCDDSDCADDPACGTPGSETDCADGQDEDGDGATDCDDSDCANDAACQGPTSESACDDGLDDDGDGAIDCDDADCATDPACKVPSTETACQDGIDDDDDDLTDCDDPDCAADPACKVPANESVCDDGIDDDDDDLTDCADPDCAADPACAPGACADIDLGSVLGMSVATGSTFGTGDDYTASCPSSSAAEDVSFTWTAPADGSYVISTDGSSFDTALTLWSTDCATELECDDDAGSGNQSLLAVSAVAGDVLVIVVDAYSSNAGDYVLNILSAGELDCADGADEDGDGAADCLDGDCTSVADCDTSFADYDLGSATGTGVAAGTTIGGGDDVTPTCPASTGAEDVTYSWIAPSAGTWTFDLSGSSYDTALVVLSPDGAELACDDDGGDATTSLVTTVARAGQLFLLGIDGSGTEAGTYSLSIY
jgi:hypothetical protein